MQTLSIANTDFIALGGPDLVYVREVSAREILAEAPAEVRDTIEVSPEQTLYAVHRGDGARLAVLGDRESAFAAALANELAPVSVH